MPSVPHYEPESERVRILVGVLRGVGGTVVGSSGKRNFLIQPDDERDTLPGPRWYDDGEVEPLPAPVHREEGRG